MEDTTICPACGSINPSESQYCMECGTLLTNITPNTSQVVPPVTSPKTVRYADPVSSREARRIAKRERKAARRARRGHSGHRRGGHHIWMWAIALFYIISFVGSGPISFTLIAIIVGAYILWTYILRK